MIVLTYLNMPPFLPHILFSILLAFPHPVLCCGDDGRNRQAPELYPTQRNRGHAYRAGGSTYFAQFLPFLPLILHSIHLVFAIVDSKRFLAPFALSLDSGKSFNTTNKMSSTSNTHIKFYHYEPSLAGACVFAILFGISTIWHLILVGKHRTWYFIPVVVGGVCMYFDSFLLPLNPSLSLNLCLHLLSQLNSLDMPPVVYRIDKCQI